MFKDQGFPASSIPQNVSSKQTLLVYFQHDDELILVKEKIGLD